VSSHEDDLALAFELADVADSITLSRFRAEDLQVETKPDLTPVTEADRAVEREIRRRLAAARPGESIVGEEYGDSDGKANAHHRGRATDNGRRWIIDPIDGTKGYMRGTPVWATLLALQQDEDVEVAVVSAPALARRWWATRGGGAFMRDGLGPEPRPLHVSAIKKLEDAQASYGGMAEWAKIGRLDALLELVSRCWRSRAFGDVWSYMLVAEGAADVGGLDPKVTLWDLAAPLLIVEEAGGRFTDFHGVRRADGGSGVATNGLLHDATLAIVGW